MPILATPHYHQGFAWSNTQNNISPAALSTKMAPPLLSSPLHLLDDPLIQATIKSLGDSIQVDTPFDVNKFELLLTDHSNQPFVKPVL